MEGKLTLLFLLGRTVMDNGWKTLSGNVPAGALLKRSAVAAMDGVKPGPDNHRGTQNG